jgi:hypothetical protein
MKPIPPERREAILARLSGDAPSISSPMSPTSPPTPDLLFRNPEKRGHGDIRGCFSFARIGENKFEEKNKKSGELNCLYRSVGEISPNVAMSPRAVIRTNWRRVDSETTTPRMAGGPGGVIAGGD